MGKYLRVEATIWHELIYFGGEYSYFGDCYYFQVLDRIFYYQIIGLGGVNL